MIYSWDQPNADVDANDDDDDYNTSLASKARWKRIYAELSWAALIVSSWAHFYFALAFIMPSFCWLSPHQVGPIGAKGCSHAREMIMWIIMMIIMIMRCWSVAEITVGNNSSELSPRKEDLPEIKHIKLLNEISISSESFAFLYWYKNTLYI